MLDLRSAHAEGLGGGAVGRLLGVAAFPKDPRFDPLQQVPLDVPVWCVHGLTDHEVPFEQSSSYVGAAVRAGGRAELVELEGTTTH